MGITRGRPKPHTYSMCKGPVAGAAGVWEHPQGGSCSWERSDEKVRVKQEGCVLWAVVQCWPSAPVTWEPLEGLQERSGGSGI